MNKKKLNNISTRGHPPGKTELSLSETDRVCDNLCVGLLPHSPYLKAKD